ncbi:MAG: hypothetical protein AAF614_25215 [Chloroflexota bacterium]
MFFAKLSSLNWRRWLTAVFILGGLALIIVYGMRTYRSFRQMSYVQAQGLDDGTASPDAIRGWMTINYIAVAYAVPEEYIYSQLDIPFERRNRRESIRDLNREYRLGRDEDDRTLQIEIAIQEAIIVYRENPVTVHLEDIRAWMTIRYIAASTGVPESYLFAAIEIPQEDDNEFKELRRLDREYDIRGRDTLEKAIEDALANYEEAS